MRSIVIGFAMVAAAVSAASCGRSADADVADGGLKRTMRVDSAAFSDGGLIPVKYTADGENVSPPLDWSGAPHTTTCYALVLDDPDAPIGTWTHWITWNVVDAKLPESVPPVPMTPSGASQGRNSWGRVGYAGPSPPSGATHRYVFHVYALDARLDLSPETDVDGLRRAMRGHALAFGELTGMYASRK